MTFVQALDCGGEEWAMEGWITSAQIVMKLYAIQIAILKLMFSLILRGIRLKSIRNSL